MTRTARIEELFDDAVVLPAAEVEPFLDRECAGDASLRREVVELLEADRRAGQVAPERIVEDTLASELEPRSIGAFEVVRRIGAGGMGIVYEAKDARLDRRVAVKVVGAGAALLEEARALAKVVHPNVVAIHEVGHAGGEDFIVMELVEGGTLATWLAREPPRSWREVLSVFAAAGRGLAAAHAAGVVHRDFKPENVLLGADARPRVVDFGAGVIGTPAYMAPEQFLGEPVDARSDQFAFAVALHRALYHRAPFAGEDVLALRDAVVAGRREPIPASEVPSEIGAAIARALAREPSARFASMEELLAVVGADPDAAVSRNKRRLAAAILTIAGIATAGSPVSATTEGLLGLALFAFGAMVVVGVVFRRMLIESAYNRRIALLFVLPVIGFIVHRLFALRLGSSGQEILLGDAISMAILLTYAAITTERWMGLVPLFCVVYIGAATIYPAWAAPGFGALLCLSAAIPVVFWQTPIVAKKMSE
ncbi:MAG: serine/threonine protein kinase [Labilithrix sp.]|nr:serine/threonine protein kinase [Labilithrix sp.]MCW5813179.1 serine/threonine protein kinase [Labilithrix sp.]